MAKSPLLTISLPVLSDPKQVRATFADVAKQHGYLTNYHTKTEHGSTASSRKARESWSG